MRKSKRPDKKGAVEVQFNWIFVLVVGGSLLILFSYIAIKQKSSAEKVQSQDILKDIRALAVTATISAGTTNSVNIGNNEIGVECNALTVKDERAGFQGLVMFGPDKIKGGSFITQTLTMEIPFKAANIVIGSSDEVRYNVLDDNSPLATELDKIISDKFNIKFETDINNFKNEKHNKVRFVFFKKNDLESDSSALTKFLEMPDNEVTAINIDVNNNKVTYYKKKGVSWKLIDVDTAKNTVEYADTTTLIGAIFIDAGFETVEKYDCVIDNLLNRIVLISQVYKERAMKLKDTNTNSNCDAPYNNGINFLGNYKPGLNIATLKTKINNPQIKDANNNLQKQSCPLIY